MSVRSARVSVIAALRSPTHRVVRMTGRDTCSPDDERTSRDALVETLARGGFRELRAV